MSDKKLWGGHRRGSGRPKQLVEPERVTIWIDKAQLEWVLARGDKSEVIRGLITEAMSKPAV